MLMGLSRFPRKMHMHTAQAQCATNNVISK